MITLKFKNTTAINCPLTVLDLLCPDQRTKDTSKRCIRRAIVAPTHVEVIRFLEKGNLAYIDRFLVSEEVTDKLIVLGFVDGANQWGYFDMKDLRITSSGVSHVDQVRYKLSPFPKAEIWLTQ